jgi:hypothetical protein
MKNATITGIVVATILMAGCGKKSPSSSATPPSQTEAKASSPISHPPERAIVTKAKSIVLPEFKLDGVTLPEALKQLRDVSKQNDPESKGFNFMITGPLTDAANPKITLALTNVTVAEAIDRVAKAAAVPVSTEDYGFLFNPKTGK